MKPDNLVLSDDYKLVAIDFGHTEKVSAKIAHTVGTRGYKGPEVVPYRPFSIERSDIYALSVTLFTIMFQDTPFTYDISPDDVHGWIS